MAQEQAREHEAGDEHQPGPGIPPVLLDRQLRAAIEHAEHRQRQVDGAGKVETPGGAGQDALPPLQRQMGVLVQLFGLIEGADVAPSEQAVTAVKEALAALDTLQEPARPR